MRMCKKCVNCLRTEDCAECVFCKVHFRASSQCGTSLCHTGYNGVARGVVRPAPSAQTLLIFRAPCTLYRGNSPPQSGTLTAKV